ncbi:MAG: DUF547 domain-containing protein [Gemmatimonadota bacterium]
MPPAHHSNPVKHILCLTLAAGLAGCAPAPPVAAQAIPNHEAFTRILADVVQIPLVDYKALEARHTELTDYLTSLAETSVPRLDAASRDVQLAFWINAYNACMLHRVVENYPLTQVRTGFFGGIVNRVAGRPANSVWQIPDVFSQAFCEVAGSRRSLDEIEHEIIRPRFQEPRIHFAVNCAARSCPPIIPSAYTPQELHQQLDQAVHRLVRAPQHFQLEAGAPPVLRLNKVLEWYAEDFGGVEGLVDFLAPYVDPTLRPILEDPELKVEFFDYDWTLNDLPR